MPWRSHYDDRDEVLTITYTGVLDADMMRTSTLENVADILKYETLRVVLDCSDAHLDVPVLNVYQLPELYAARGVSRQVRAAVILPKDKYKVEIFEFYEDVCRNRGYFVKLFEKLEDGIAWLHES